MVGFSYSFFDKHEFLTKFPTGYQGINIAYFSKQLIAKEIESEVLRRMAPKASGPVRLQNNTTRKTPANHLQSLQPRINEKSKGKEVEKRVSVFSMKI